MGFDDKEYVAIMGSHCLGGARKDRSGFEGTWTKEPLKFDNTYYMELLDKESTQLKTEVDLELIQEERFRNFVEKFATDKALFFEEFKAAFEKMSEFGQEANVHE